MRKHYFFFDIDGTLAAGPIMGRYIPESTKRALEILKSEGHFAICTGRLHAMGEGFMHELGFQNMVADGGNSLTLDGEFGDQTARYASMYRRYRGMRGLGVVWAISFDDSRRRWTRYDKYDALVHDSYMETVVDPELDYRSIEYFYKVYVICSSEEERRIASLSKAYGAFQPICRVR